MTDGDCERLFERAGAALRTPPPDEDRARDRLLGAIRADTARSHSASRRALLPWWGTLAAAALAFAVGLGTGRATSRQATTVTAVAGGSIEAASRQVEFVFVAPA